MTVAKTTFEANKALRGQKATIGGAVAIFEGAQVILLEAVVFRANVAMSRSISGAKGGAVFVTEYPSVLVAHFGTQFVANTAEGSDPAGGALAVGSSAPKTVSLRGALFDSNLVIVQDENEGMGGAISCYSGNLLLEECNLHSNQARMKNYGFDTSGGALFVAKNASVTLVRTQLWSNDAGGIGTFEVGGVIAKAVRSRDARAAHIACNGACTLTDSLLFQGEGSGERLPWSADWWIVGRESAVLVLKNSTFRSSTNEGLLALFDSSALLRGCRAINMSIRKSDEDDDGSKLGIVDSEFEPALSLDVRTIGPPLTDSCGIRPSPVLEPVCDVRAYCLRLPTGGVTCRCEGRGLRPKPGMQDGTRCVQELSTVLQLVTPALRLKLAKPGSWNRSVILQMTANGEQAFNASLLFTHALHRRKDGTWFDTSINRSLSFGSEIAMLGSPPSSQLRFDLDEAKSRFVATLQNPLAVSIKCVNSTTVCPGDGDVIKTSISLLGHTTDLLDKESYVTIETEVQSSPSCEFTTAEIPIPTDGLFQETVSLPILVKAVDVDGQGIGYSNLVIKALWQRKSEERYDEVILQRNGAGSNIFSGEIPLSVRELPGLYTLRVQVYDGFQRRPSKKGAVVPECTIFETSLEVQPPFSTMWIFVGSAVACVVVATVLLLLARKYMYLFEGIWELLITEMVQTVFTLIFELTSILVDSYSFYRAVIDNSLGATPGVQVIYQVRCHPPHPTLAQPRPSRILTTYRRTHPDVTNPFPAAAYTPNRRIRTSNERLILQFMMRMPWPSCAR